MNSNTQNEKITSITENTLIVGMDIGSMNHFARSFDWRKVECSKKPFPFLNTEDGFTEIHEWIEKQREDNNKKDVIVGMEPTGHYWINLAIFLIGCGYKVVHVNPAHVKKSKEMDDNSPSKNDRKDPKVIAGLVSEGRYCIPYIPDGIYADLREYNFQIRQITQRSTELKNLIARWFSIYFPNFLDVYSSYTAKSALMVLDVAPLPDDIVKLGEDGINKIWRDAKLRGVGPKKASELVEAARHSVGSKRAADAAREEIKRYIRDLKQAMEDLAKLKTVTETVLLKVPYIEKLLAIKGVGFGTALGFVAEVGDISRFHNPKELQKLAGLQIVNNESCKYKGRPHISYRGRKHLRYVMYEAAISVLGHCEEFQVIHKHFTERKQNPLRKMQSVIAVSCKLIRIFYAVLTRGIDFDAKKMLADIRWEEEAA